MGCPPPICAARANVTRSFAPNVWLISSVFAATALWGARGAGGEPEGAAPSLDAAEIARTEIARRLVAAGFVERPPSSGLYTQTGPTLTWLRENFGPLTIEPVPSVASWTRATRINGNHTVLVPAPEATVPVDELTALTVTVNLGYARPLRLSVGMTARRAAEALALIHADQWPTARCGRMTRPIKGETPHCFRFPDRTLLWLSVEQTRLPPGQKPTEPLVTAIRIGEPRKGATGSKRPRWERIDSVPVFQFRPPFFAAEQQALCAAWRAAREPKVGQLRVARCAFAEGTRPISSGRFVLSLLEVLYWTQGQSQLDRWIVLHDRARWQIVANLADLFGDAWVGVQQRKLRLRPGHRFPLIQLATLIDRHPQMDCLFATETVRSLVVCGKRGKTFCCRRLDTARELTVEMSGSVHPHSSQYDVDVAERCRPVLSQYDLSTPDHDRRIIENRTTPVTFVDSDRVRWTQPTGQSIAQPVDEMLAAGICRKATFAAAPRSP